MGCNFCDDCSDCAVGGDWGCDLWDDAQMERRSGYWDDDCWSDWPEDPSPAIPEKPTALEDVPTEGTISWIHAGEHVGEESVISGPVASVHWDSERDRLAQYFPELGTVELSPVFIDVGTGYADKRGLRLVIWGRNRHRFPPGFARELIGRRIVVSGSVYMFGGAANIEVKDPRQITIVEAAWV